MAVFRAYYTDVNAKLQSQAIALGGEINYLTPGEGEKADKTISRCRPDLEPVEDAFLPTISKVPTALRARTHPAACGSRCLHRGRTLLRKPAGARYRRRHGQEMAEIGEAGDAVARISDAAGHDRREMRQVGLHIDRDAVERHPAPQPHADRGDLVLVAFALVRPGSPRRRRDPRGARPAR